MNPPARAFILQWAEAGLIRAARVGDALRVTGAVPGPADWRRFVDRVLLWSGATFLAIAVIFFFAYNWTALGRFAQFGLAQLLIVACVAAYAWLDADSAAAKASLLAASILMGALLALFGQTYQTGADTFELFAGWAVLILPWVAVARFAPLWIVWLALANLAISLFFHSGSPRFLGSRIDRELFVLFAFNTAALASWETAARRVPWLDERWAVRILALASAALATLVALNAIFDNGVVLASAPVYLVWLVAAYAVYRRIVCDLFMLAAGCLSAIVVATALLGRILFEGHDVVGGLFLIALAVVAMSAGAAIWLRSVAAERYA